jgi:hypothetical protein
MNLAWLISVVQQLRARLVPLNRNISTLVIGNFNMVAAPIKTDSNLVTVVLQTNLAV